ncbi:hypothetical protein NA78x_000053 [Anatilimnocola sp. NA78]|uniref:hypothetical protein n=1 Tax=Anatilimnocola sp. NA78 TaxID=3415683 RepID=UPI003CE5B488
MSERERLLAIVVGACAAVIAVWMGWGFYAGMVKYRRDNISALSKEVADQTAQIRTITKATKKLNEYEARSLPPDTALARSLYQSWLLNKLQDAGLRDQLVSPNGQRPQEKNFVQQTFTVNGKGRYEQIVKLLHDLYSVDMLHRVSRVSLKPVKDSKELDLQLTLDALSLYSAAPTTKLNETPAKRLKLPTLLEYQNSIVGRNIFAPPNKLPQVSGLGRQRGTTNRSFELSAKASDPDPLDKVLFELVKSPIKDAKLNADGKFSFTPRKAGEYEFEIAVRDDNFPPRPKTEKLIVTVTDPLPEKKPDPPPPVDPDAEPKLAFDHAKHTVLSAVISVGAEGEIWLYVRPTAQLLKLHKDEPFEIGSIRGTVRQILDDEFVYESANKKTKGKMLRVAKGEILEQAAVTAVSTSSELSAPVSEDDSAPQNKLDASEATPAPAGEPKLLEPSQAE